MIVWLWIGVALLIATLGFLVGALVGATNADDNWIDAASDGRCRCVRGRRYYVHDDSDERLRSQIVAMLARDRS